MAETESMVDELLLLVGFLLTSAHGLLDEPPSYGPSRLLEAAGRVLDIMDGQGLIDDALHAVKSQIDEERFGPMDEEGVPARLDQLALRWTELIAGRF